MSERARSFESRVEWVIEGLILLGTLVLSLGGVVLSVLLFLTVLDRL